MERVFKKGDLVECIDNSGFHTRHLTNGKIYEVFDLNGNFVHVKCDDGVLRAFKPFRFKLHKAAEEQPTTETLKQTEMRELFKKGDLVECIDSKWYPECLTKGKIYEALDANSDVVYVKCDDGLFRSFELFRFKLHCAVEELEPSAAIDMVNNPPHYNQGSVECIEAIKAALTPGEFRGHCKANAMKYIWREKHKGGKESIEKAIWYLKQLL